MRNLLLILLVMFGVAGCSTTKQQQQSFEAAQELVRIHKIEQHLLQELRYMMTVYYQKTGQRYWVATVIVEQVDDIRYTGHLIVKGQLGAIRKVDFSCVVPETWVGVNDFQFLNEDQLKGLDQPPSLEGAL
jgi:hypothetical protein